MQLGYRDRLDPTSDQAAALAAAFGCARVVIRLTRNGFSLRPGGRLHVARAGPKPLEVRGWVCRACATVHDRDANVASNILAAGRAVAACGGHVGPGVSPAVAGEAGTNLAGVA